MKSLFWNPWHGCHKCSPGCLNCYVYFLDKKRDKDASIITKSKTNFNIPLKKDRQGNYKITSGSELATCFTSDFFLPEADEWRIEAWKIIENRPDVNFLICTKRIERFFISLPNNWGTGYPNVTIAVTCENQAMADKRIPILLKVPTIKKYIFVSPILEYVDLKSYLATGQINMVSVGGESYDNARLCDFEWIKKIYKDCLEYNVSFDFHQTGSNFKMNNKIFKINHHNEHNQAKKGTEYLKRLH